MYVFVPVPYANNHRRVSVDHRLYIRPVRVVPELEGYYQRLIP
ncbi:hypothetical protein [Desulfosporosinus sp. OT]|nr:hypothetical protein [Desulfosporosinus sp. OT]